MTETVKPSNLRASWSALFAVKPIQTLEPNAAPPSALPRTFGVFSLTCFGVGSTIGAGIFVLTGTIAAEHAGPAAALSFVLAGIACAFAGLCYAEFAALVPMAGSAYLYAYATLGEVFGWMVGWCLILEYLFASAMVAIGWSSYVGSLAADLGVAVPATFMQAPFEGTATGLVATGGLCNLPAVVAVLICTALLVISTRASARVNEVIVVATVGAIVIVGAAGLLFAEPSHWSPFLPPNAGHFGEFGYSGVLAGGALAFYAYVGFDSVSTMAQETHNAQRVVPRALIWSLCICTLLYVLMALMVTGLIDYRALGVANPVYVALSAAGPRLLWARSLIGVVIVVGLFSALLTTLLGQVRIFYAMARDGLMPPLFAAIHRRWRTPYIGTLLTGATAAVIAGMFPLKLLGELISIGTLLAFAMVSLGVMVLRVRRPELPRPFRVPGYPWTPVSGIVVCAVLMASLPRDTWIRLAVWLVLGLLVYGGYGFRHSLLRRSSRPNSSN